MSDNEPRLTISVDTYRGEVMIVLNRAVQWISLPPDDAEKIAEVIKAAAAKIRESAKAGSN